MEFVAKRYKSRVGLIIGAISLCGFIAMLAPLVMGVVEGDKALIMTGLATLLFVVPFVDLFVYTDYTIHADELVVRCGHLDKTVIRISDITMVRPVRSVGSAKAWSADRLSISYAKNRNIEISPRMQHLFVEDLLSRNPKIEVDKYL